jgi:hypothetical protein
MVDLMAMMRRALSAAAVLLLGLGSASPPAGAAGTVGFEVFAPDGTISRATVSSSALPRAGKAADVTAEVHAIQQTGDPAGRYDLVFVGDGYTASEQHVFGGQAVARWQQLISREPFRSLAEKFNVWEVDVVSRESGSDNDPTRGVQRDTALNGGYFCGDLDRLVCVDDRIARQYAALAPGADQVLVLVNSATYGGSGGGVTVSAGGNPASGDIVAHELGHSIGNLQDEYGGNCTYTGSEPGHPNASKLNESQMRQLNAKWAAYLGRPTPDGGAIGAFEGGSYCDRGVFRPSQDSMMRSLGREFNLIGVDAITAAVNAHVRPVTPG